LPASSTRHIADRGRAHRGLFIATVVASLGYSSPALAAEWYVAPGAPGLGTSESPFASIQAALDVARAGDVITVRPGTYREAPRSTRDGPIELRAERGRGSVIVTSSGRVLTVTHAALTVDGLTFDGQYGNDDTIRVATPAHGFVLRNAEVRRSSKDLIDIAGPREVLIEGCLIHHALNATNGRTDAHGVVAGPIQKLTIKDSEIHTFSGDGIQLDPGRAAPGWQALTLEELRIWLAPLPALENGFAAGTVPGENALDTKANPAFPRASVLIRNVTASGFRGGLISNMAAFNLKEHIDAQIDAVTVFDSEIAFRVRGAGAKSTGARVTVSNAVVYDVATAYRYEDDIQELRVWNNTLGRSVARAFRAAASPNARPEIRNLLLLGTSLPREASHSSNMAVDERAFVSATRDDYRLTQDARAIDRGVALEPVRSDREGNARPSGSAYDIGAYEWQPGRLIGPRSSARQGSCLELPAATDGLRGPRAAADFRPTSRARRTTSSACARSRAARRRSAAETR
jgi:hypothetical protein